MGLQRRAHLSEFLRPCRRAECRMVALVVSNPVDQSPPADEPDRTGDQNSEWLAACRGFGRTPPDCRRRDAGNEARCIAVNRIAATIRVDPIVRRRQLAHLRSDLLKRAYDALLSVHL